MSGYILDLGGGPASFFASIFPRPEQVICVDINYTVACQAKLNQSSLHIVVANGQRLPLANQSVDATVCNSVVEHVADPSLLAAEIKRVSKRYFLQTPNMAFPLELHSHIPIPFFHLIPFRWLQRLVSRIFGANFDYINSVCYLSERQLKDLFPEAQITYERVLGLKKSFYVQRMDE
jgi:ubiquinone/menaquinone biosynthesis C-methylase UbiE